jgi:hypothetical protein
MSRATETKLAALHGAVAECLVEQIEAVEEETIFDENGLEQKTGNMVRTVTPATLAVATKFLKDNQITCEIEQNENMETLSDLLSKKQQRSRLGSASVAAKLQVVN